VPSHPGYESYSRRKGAYENLQRTGLVSDELRHVRARMAGEMLKAQDNDVRVRLFLTSLSSVEVRLRGGRGFLNFDEVVGHGFEL
jgi:hypothetical protein